MHAAIRRVAGLTAVIAALAFPGAAFAAPVNDNYFVPGEPQFPNFNLNAAAGETDIAATGDATEYNQEPLSPTDPRVTNRCSTSGTQAATGSQMVKTVWWSFTGTGGPLTVSSYFSGFDTVLAVWIVHDAGLEFIKCNDDLDPSDFTSELVLPTTTAGQLYHVQVGGCFDCDTPFSGSLGFYVFPPPSNDRRAGATAVNLGQNVATKTYGAQGDTDGAQTCTGRAYGKTIWHRFVVPKTGTATIDASGFDSAVALYQGASTTPLACGVGLPDGATSISRRLTAGTYFVQVGGQGAGLTAARGNLNTRVSFAADPDPVIQPPVPTPIQPIIKPPAITTVRSTYDHLGVWGATGKFTTLDILNVPAKAKIQVTCRGKGCKRKRFVKNVRRATKRVKFAKSMRRNRKLRPGAVVEVRVTAPNRIGKVFRFKIRSFKAPTRKTLCLPPGAKKPRACS